MQSFINNFLAGELNAVVVVGTLAFMLIFVLAVAVLGIKLKLQSDKAFVLAVVIAISVLIPLTIRQASISQNITSQAQSEATISNTNFFYENNRQGVAFKSSVPAAIYLKYSFNGKENLILPEYILSKRTDHMFYIDTVPVGIHFLMLVIDGRNSKQTIQIP